KGFLMSKRAVSRLCVGAIVSAVVAAGVAEAATPTKYGASLSGAKEVGGKGDPNAKGTFAATVNGTQLCYTLIYSGVSKPLAAHIHKGTATQNGSIVVDLKPTFSNGKAAACVPIKTAVASAIRKNPSKYYTNVHTQKYPNGIMRGQLSMK
ncbi:MAG: hypothetical protein QOF26_822, partial [Baekduia sp.]|nr:hypothetical protein [Baekduia sp.]